MKHYNCLKYWYWCFTFAI